MCTNYYCLSHFILCTTTFWPFRFFFPIVVLCKMVFSDCYTIQNAYLSRFLRPNFQRLMCIQSPFSLPHSTFPNVHSPFFFFFSSLFPPASSSLTFHYLLPHSYFFSHFFLLFPLFCLFISHTSLSLASHNLSFPFPLLLPSNTTTPPPLPFPPSPPPTPIIHSRKVFFFSSFSVIVILFLFHCFFLVLTGWLLVCWFFCNFFLYFFNIVKRSSGFFYKNPFSILKISTLPLL